MTPEGWRCGPVSALGEVVAGKAKDKNGAGPLRPYLRVANVFDGRIDVSDVLEMPFSDVEFTRFRLQRGDVLLNEGQSLELVGRCAMYRGEYPGPCAIQNALIRFRAGAAITPNYSEQLFRWCQGVGVFAEIATQTTSIAHLGVKRFGDLELTVPPLGEQRKIASILASVDEAIEATHAVIEQLQVVKKAMMAELLTRGMPGRHTRFKQTEIGEVPEHWKAARLGDVLKVQGGFAFKSAAFCDEGTQVVRMSNLKRGRLDLAEAVRIRPDDILGLDAFKLNEGDVVLGLSGSIGPTGSLGNFARIVAHDLPAYLNQRVGRLVPASAELLPAFALAIVSAERFRLSIEEMATAQAQANISPRQIEDLVWPLPPPCEQEEICRALEILNSRLNAEGAVHGALTAMKSALMSVLLTGEVRVKPDPEPA